MNIQTHSMISGIWYATLPEYDGADDSSHPIGTGATEQEAIADLMMQVEDDLD